MNRRVVLVPVLVSLTAALPAFDLGASGLNAFGGLGLDLGAAFDFPNLNFDGLLSPDAGISFSDKAFLEGLANEVGIGSEVFAMGWNLSQALCEPISINFNLGFNPKFKLKLNLSHCLFTKGFNPGVNVKAKFKFSAKFDIVIKKKHADTLGFPIYGNARFSSYNDLPNPMELFNKAKDSEEVAANRDLNAATARTDIKRSDSKLDKVYCSTEYTFNAEFYGLYQTGLLKNKTARISEGTVAASPVVLLQSYSPALMEVCMWQGTLTAQEVASSKVECAVIGTAMTSRFGHQLQGPGYQECMSQFLHKGLVVAAKNCNSYKSAMVGHEVDGKIVKVAPLSDGPKKQGAGNLPIDLNPLSDGGFNPNTFWALGQSLGGDAKVKDKHDYLRIAINDVIDPEKSKAQNDEEKDLMAKSAGIAPGDISSVMAAQDDPNARASSGRGAAEESFMVAALGSLAIDSKNGLLYRPGDIHNVNEARDAMARQRTAKTLKYLYDYGEFINACLAAPGRAVPKPGSPEFAKMQAKMQRFRFKITEEWPVITSAVPPWAKENVQVAPALKQRHFSSDTVDKLAHLIFRLDNMTVSPDASNPGVASNEADAGNMTDSIMGPAGEANPYEDASAEGSPSITSSEKQVLLSFFRPEFYVRSIHDMELAHYQYYSVWTRHVGEVITVTEAKVRGHNRDDLAGQDPMAQLREHRSKIDEQLQREQLAHLPTLAEITGNIALYRMEPIPIRTPIDNTSEPTLDYLDNLSDPLPIVGPGSL